ncbi:isoprenylcysteine carboxylmethyltransferase family protein [Eubacteriales bacterium OttesenSCG-928-A19]|nr:isoprenylcysteine carboxylmethyltransferase family protein [Eubacteriales bacterium OttesenSCG-928-A19]
MNAALLLAPLFLIRYGLLSILSKEAAGRAAHFAPMLKNERAAYWVYQGATVAMVVYMFLLKIHTDQPWFYPGLIAYAIGSLLLVLAIIGFAKPMNIGFQTKGIYSVSRNPMYVAYFLYFLGCAGLTRSILLLAVLLLFQISAHWIILAEERWCRQQYGEAYAQYKSKVRRYI